VGLKLDCLVATTDDQRLGFDRLAGLEVLVPGVNHHLASSAVGHDFGLLRTRITSAVSTVTSEPAPMAINKSSEIAPLLS
jgi:hypothetical protein